MNNTVKLSLEQYDKLKGCEKAVENGYYLYGGYSNQYYTIERDDVLLKLKDEIDRLNKKIYDLENPKDITTIEDVKNMSLISLIKWKLKNK